MSHGNRFLFKNGVVSPAADTPSVAAFLEANPGAYTTTRTHSNGSEILFWQRHLHRLSNSFKLLLKDNPKLIFRKPEIPSARLTVSSNQEMVWDSVIRCLVNDSLRKAMPFVVKERRLGEELAITTLLSGNVENLENKKGGFDEGMKPEALDVYLHVSGYVPPVFGARENTARLALVGRGRDFANAKYSDWVRLRKCLDKWRPPSVNELLLSNDGERILEGCLTNFFVVSLKEKPGDGDNISRTDLQSLKCIEVQTAPVSDGVLPGILRQVIIDICLEIGIPFREVAPSWSERELWTEAFITNSLRTLQHVETVQAPSAWDSMESKTWEEIMWIEKRFEDTPGKITSIFQVMLKIKLQFDGREENIDNALVIWFSHLQESSSSGVVILNALSGYKGLISKLLTPRQGAALWIPLGQPHTLLGTNFNLNFKTNNLNFKTKREEVLQRAVGEAFPVNLV